MASSTIESIALIDKTFCELSLKFGIILQRWNQAIDVMIPKKANNNRVNHLCTIMLFEQDQNFINQIIGKRNMSQGESANSTPPEQYRSRNSKSNRSAYC